MKKLTALNVLILVAVLFVTAYGQTTRRIAWEYRVEFSTQTEQAPLNRLGQEGWELVAVESVGGTVTAFYLKRQK